MKPLERDNTVYGILKRYLGDDARALQVSQRIRTLQENRHDDFDDKARLACCTIDRLTAWSFSDRIKHKEKIPEIEARLREAISEVDAYFDQNQLRQEPVKT